MFNSGVRWPHHVVFVMYSWRSQNQAFLFDSRGGERHHATPVPKISTEIQVVVLITSIDNCFARHRCVYISFKFITNLSASQTDENL